MTKLYDKLEQTALRLINKYGYNKAKYYRQVEVKNNWSNEFELEEKIVDIIVLPSSKYSRETNRLQGEKAMLDYNYNAYLSTQEFIPNINDYFIVNDTTHTVMSVIRINPNGKDVVFKLELK